MQSKLRKLEEGHTQLGKEVAKLQGDVNGMRLQLTTVTMMGGVLAGRGGASTMLSGGGGSVGGLLGLGAGRRQAMPPPSSLLSRELPAPRTSAPSSSSPASSSAESSTEKGYVHCPSIIYDSKADPQEAVRPLSSDTSPSVCDVLSCGC